MTDSNKLQTVLVDGIPVVVTDSGATVIKTLQDRLATQVADGLQASVKHAAAITAKDAEIAAKDRELGTKDAEIERLKKEAPTDVVLDAMATERATVLDGIRGLGVAVETAGKSLPDLRRAAVAASLGDARVANRGDEYVQALFDGLVENLGAALPARASDPVANLVRDSRGTVDPSSAHLDMRKRMENAWMNPPKGVN